MKKPKIKTKLPVTWITKDGREMEPRKMETAHLLNCVRMMMRVAAVQMTRERWRMLEDSLSALAYAGGAPDGAAMAAEGESDALMDKAHRMIAKIGSPEAQLEKALGNIVVKTMYNILLRRGVRRNTILS